jgi:hypothetical protein
LKDTLECNPHLLLLVRLEVEAEVRLDSVALLEGVGADGIQILLEDRGEEVSLDRCQLLTEGFNERIEFPLSRCNAALLGGNKFLIEYSKPLSIEADLQCRFSIEFGEFDVEIYVMERVILL